MLDNQLSKFRTKTWVEINDDSSGTNSDKSSVVFKNLKAKFKYVKDKFMWLLWCRYTCE